MIFPCRSHISSTSACSDTSRRCLILQIGVAEGDLLLPCWGIGQGGGNEVDFAFQQRGNTPVGCHRNERHGVGVTEPASGQFAHEIDIKTDPFLVGVEKRKGVEIFLDSGRQAALLLDLGDARGLLHGYR